MLRLRRFILFQRARFTRFTHHFVAPLRIIGDVLGAMACIMSVVCLLVLIIHFGYHNSDTTRLMLERVMRACQLAFVMRVVYELVFNPHHSLRNVRAVKWIVDSALMLTVVVWIFPEPRHPWIAWLTSLLYSHGFFYGVMAVWSIVELSYMTIRIIGKRTNPSLILSGSFLVLIMLGSLLLMLPRCTHSGISYPDALFVSTSAVCITGLTPVDIATTFTPIGQVVLALLIQAGGLGVMTFACFFAMFFSGNNSVYSQLFVRDVIYSKSINALLPTLLYVLGFTLVIEAVGAVAVWLSIHGTMGLTLEREMAFAAFHSLSSFCNAGFSIAPEGLSSPEFVYGDQSIYWVTSVLVVAGGIGFPILVNLKEMLFNRARRAWLRLHQLKESTPVHVWSLNSRMALVTTSILFGVGAVAFMALEYSNSLEGMTMWQKVSQSVFNSVTPRSAGFSSVNPAGFLPATLLVVMFLMAIGGSSQSMAGGVKVNTLATLWFSLRATLTGSDGTAAFHRNISGGSVRRAQAVVTIAIMAFVVYSVTILILEPALSTRDVIFEVISALFTVGSSLGATSHLSAASEVVICTAMFLGRVGLVSLMAGFISSPRDKSVHYPIDNVIIN